MTNTDRPTLAPAGMLCIDCEAEAEAVPASYILPNGDAVCDTHFDIHQED